MYCYKVYGGLLHFRPKWDSEAVGGEIPSSAYCSLRSAHTKFETTSSILIYFAIARIGGMAGKEWLRKRKSVEIIIFQYWVILPSINAPVAWRMEIWANFALENTYIHCAPAAQTRCTQLELPNKSVVIRLTRPLFYTLRPLWCLSAFPKCNIPITPIRPC